MAEVNRQVRGQDGVLDHCQNLGVFSRRQTVQDPVSVKIEDDQRLVEMVSLQGGAGVQLGQRRVGGLQVVAVGS